MKHSNKYAISIKRVYQPKQYAISTKRIRQPKHQVRHFNPKSTPIKTPNTPSQSKEHANVNFSPQYRFTLFCREAIIDVNLRTFRRTIWSFENCAGVQKITNYRYDHDGNTMMACNWIGAQCNLIAQCTPGTICVWLVVCALCSVHWSGDIWSDWLQCSVLCRLPDAVKHNQGLIWCILVHIAWCRVPGAWCSDMWSGWNLVYFFDEQCTVLRCVVRVYVGAQCLVCGAVIYVVGV